MRERHQDARLRGKADWRVETGSSVVGATRHADRVAFVRNGFVRDAASERHEAFSENLGDVEHETRARLRLAAVCIGVWEGEEHDIAARE